jgi:hypothetical protein
VGLIPAIRMACPSEIGFILVSFSWASLARLSISQ